MIFKTIYLTVVSLVSATLFASASAIAQTTTTNSMTLSEQTLREAQQQERGSLSLGGGNLNLLQLINSINLAGGKSPEKFRIDQDESFEDAVSNFKNQQRREIKVTIPTAPN